MTDEKDTRFDDKLPATPPPSPLRASNTLESLRPREVNAFLDTPTSGEPLVQKTDYAIRELFPQPIIPEKVWDALKESQGAVEKASGANVLPVNWPTSSNKPKPVILPSAYDRVTKLEEQVDALLDRIALHNVRSSHKI